MCCLLPVKAARGLKTLITDEFRPNPKAEIKFRQEIQLEFEIGNKTITAREITGNFPNREMIIPKEFEAFAEISAGDFAMAPTRGVSWRTTPTAGFFSHSIKVR